MSKVKASETLSFSVRSDSRSGAIEQAAGLARTYFAVEDPSSINLQIVSAGVEQQYTQHRQVINTVFEVEVMAWLVRDDEEAPSDVGD